MHKTFTSEQIFAKTKPGNMCDAVEHQLSETYMNDFMVFTLHLKFKFLSLTLVVGSPAKMADRASPIRSELNSSNFRDKVFCLINGKYFT